MWTTGLAGGGLGWSALLVDPVSLITHLGGVGGTARVARECGRRALERAIAERRLVRPFRGVVTVPGTPLAVAAAARYRGFASHDSAAEVRGCALLRPPEACHVTVPAKSRKRAADERVRLHYADVPPHDRCAGPWSLTSRTRAVVDCARTLPLSDAVVIGDSALRLPPAYVDGGWREVRPAELARRAGGLRGPGSWRVRLAVGLLDPRAESVLESAFRVLVHVAGFPPPKTQVWLLHDAVRVDFYWPAAHVVVEVEGYGAHSGRSGWLADCRRHNRLLAGGYRSLRFTWNDVLHGHRYVVETLRAVLGDAGVTPRR